MACDKITKSHYGLSEFFILVKLLKLFITQVEAFLVSFPVVKLQQAALCKVLVQVQALI